MKVLKFLAKLIIVFVIILGLGAWYMGLLNKVVIEEKPMGPYTIVYVEHTGDYKNVGKAMNDLYLELQTEGINQIAGIGIYYDDPAKVPADQLRSDLGSVIDPNDTPKLDPKSTIYKLKTIPAGTKVVVAFPYKNTFSYMLGPIKVYPEVNKYITEKGYNMTSPKIELYDQTNKITYFISDK